MKELALLFGEIALAERAGESGLSVENVCGGSEKRYIYETPGAGGAFFDYDADGDLDVYLVNGSLALDEPGPPNKLFRNDGAGRFRDVTDESGTGDTDFGVAAAMADTDADGDLDLYVANSGPDVLFVNEGDGTFRRADDQLLPRDALMAGGAAFGDYERDGLPDVYVSSYVDASTFRDGREGARWCSWRGLRVGCGPRGLPGAPDRLYRNRDGRFEDVSESSGSASVDPSHGLGILFLDLDGDGLADIYVANDSRPNFLFINRSDGKFSEDLLRRAAGYSGEGLEQAGMGVDAGDIDEDGDVDVDVDLVVKNFSHVHTTLYQSHGAGHFADASYTLGLAKPSYFELSWGARFVDFDADGRRDLFGTTGHIYPHVQEEVPECSYASPNHVFMNEGRGAFRLQEGLSLPSHSSRGTASDDYDNDGRVDVLVTNIDGPPGLLRKKTIDAGSALMVQLVGRRSSPDCAGARVSVAAVASRRWRGDLCRRLRERQRSQASLRIRHRDRGRGCRGAVAERDARSRAIASTRLDTRSERRVRSARCLPLRTLESD